MAEWTGSNVEITLVIGVRCHISLMSIRYNRGFPLTSWGRLISRGLPATKNS